MGIFKYPYTDLHELNLDMILAMIKQLDHKMDDFMAVNEITNAGAWDITKQYQAWTIVSDNRFGYISLKPVPAGVSISNTEYWGLVADYDILITNLTARVAALENTVGDASSGLVKNVNDLNTLTAADHAKLDNLDVVNVKDYGALGDGTTDDTAAFQAALNTGLDVFIPFSKGEHYVIYNQLNLTADRQQVYGTSYNEVWDDTTPLATTKQGCIYFKGSGTLFNASGLMGVRFRNLTMATDFILPFTYQNTAILIDATSVQDNADAMVSGCSFYGWLKILEAWGRGCGFIDCSCWAYGTAYEAHYTFDGTGASDVQQPAYGFRGVRLENNRFHLGNNVLRVLSGLLYGANITGNVSDGGALFIDVTSSASGMKNCVVSSNSCPNWGKAQWLVARKGIFNDNVIIGNTVASMDAATTPNRFIHITPQVTEFKRNTISGNTFKHCSNDAIFIEPECEGTVITGNTIVDVCSTSSLTISPIRFNSDAHNTTIIGNACFIHADGITLDAIRFYDTINNTAVDLTGCNVSGNTSNTTHIVGGLYNQPGPKTNTLQSDY